MVTDDDRPVPTVSPELAAASKPSKLHSFSSPRPPPRRPRRRRRRSGVFSDDGVGRPGASVRR
ncbi:hypothetical protein ACFPRL_17030 [Pseudoclavibacter helvolus]